VLPNGVVVISQEHAADPRHVSGPVILFERPVKVGDAVQIVDVTNWTPADHQRRLWCVACFGGDGA